MAEPVENHVPPDMSKTARNERLMEHLMSLGLFVEPVYAESGRQIEYLKVTTFLPWAKGELSATR